MANTQLPPLVELIQHLKNEHDITNVCTNCGAFFANKKDLQLHLAEEQHFHHLKSQFQSHNENSQLSKRIKKDSPPVKATSFKSLPPATLPVSKQSSSSCNNATSNVSTPSNNTKNHPLLALQMFVNGNSEITSNSSPNESKLLKVSTSSYCEKQVTISKLPAKKRPYHDLDDDDDQEAKRKHVKLEKEFVAESRLVAEQPLNLLQRMHLNLDNY